MGVKGLTGYVASHEKSAGQRTSFKPVDKEIPLIIDGSAFLYRICRLHIDWTHGGESTALRAVLTAYVSAFRNASILPIFVWDGAFPLTKLETVTSRLLNSIRSSISYMRAGSSLRANRGFQVEKSMMAILAKRAMVAILRELGVDQRFPGEEADPVIAQLAADLDAYILSQDSDFFVTAHGSRGYVPLDSLTFVQGLPEGPATPSAYGDAEDGWASVQSRSVAKKVRSKISQSLEDIAACSEISCIAYLPSTIATQLGIRTSWLPLLAVLAGNDYYTPPIWRTVGMPLGGPISAQKRVDLIARSMVKCGSKLRAELDKDSLPDFLARVISETREFAMTDGQISDIVGQCTVALAQYSTSGIEASASFMPPPAPAHESPVAAFASPDPQAENYLLKARLFNAYENGHFPAQLLQIVSTGVYAPLASLEDPDAQSCEISCGRELRTWIYALLQASIGIYQPSAEHANDEEIDVDREEASEASDAIGHASQTEKLTSNGVEQEVEEGEEIQRSPLVPIVTEHVRRGATLTAEILEIPPLPSLLAAAGKSERLSLSSSTIDRFRLFLRITSSSTATLCEPEGAHLPVLATIAALRHLAFTFQHSKTHAWTSRDRVAALAMALLASRRVTLDRVPLVEQTNKSIQRAAQLTTALHSVGLLAECLLLVPLILPSAGETHFDGRVSAYMLTLEPEDIDGIVLSHGIDQSEWERMKSMIEEDLPNVEEERKLSKNERRKRNQAARSSVKDGAGPNASTGLDNRFAFLAQG